MEYKGYIIKIEQDTDGIDSPREWEPSTVMLCDTKRYNLGDVKNCDLESEIISLWLDHATSKELRKKLFKDMRKTGKHIEHYTYIKSCAPASRVLKSMFEQFYEHEFNILGKSPDDIELPLKLTWKPLYLYDHGNISISNHKTCRWDSGFIGIHYIIDDGSMTLENQYKALQVELEVYDQYLRGDVYWFATETKDGDLIDSCGGFFGYQAVLEEAQASIDYLIRTIPQQLELNFEGVKA